MDPFFSSILAGLGSGASQGAISLIGQKHDQKEKRRLQAEQQREQMAALLNSLLDRNNESEALDVNRAMRSRQRSGNSMMEAASGARRALGG